MLRRVFSNTLLASRVLLRTRATLGYSQLFGLGRAGLVRRGMCCRLSDKARDRSAQELENVSTCTFNVAA